MPQSSRQPVGLALSLALVLAACGDTTDEAASKAPPDTPTSSQATDTDTAPATDTSVEAEETAPTNDQSETNDQSKTNDGDGSDDAPDGADQPVPDLRIDGSFQDGEIVIPARRYEVPTGSSVLITFQSDEAEELHLHGYDLLVDLVPGEPAELAFVADSPGSFEAELEGSGRFLFELLVR